MNRKRNSSIELLRIIAILLIISCHFSTHGLFRFDYVFGMDYLYMNLLTMGGDLGVDIFVLISGYFLINDKKENGRRIFDFWIEVFFYSVLIYLLVCIFGFEQFSAKELIKNFLPIAFNRWWFAGTYFVLLVLHPYLNVLLHGIEKKQYERMLVILVLFWSIIPTFLRSDFNGNTLLWFITLYFISAYIRLYPSEKKPNLKKYLILFVTFTIIPYVIRNLHNLGLPIPYISVLSGYIYTRQSVFTLLRAMCLFLFFVKKEAFFHPLINKVASATFAIYLLHDSDYIRPILWQTVYNLNPDLHIGIILYSVICVVCIYLICLTIEMFRQFLFKCTPVRKLNERIFVFVQKLYETVESRTLSLFEKFLSE